MNSPELPITLVIVDDHVLFRRGLISLLEAMPEFRVLGEAGNGIEALEVLKRCRPNICLMDVNMPEMGGIETVAQIRREQIPVIILMLTISNNDEDLLGAIRAGADGYLLKNIEPEELRRSLLHISAGEGVLSPEVTGAVLRAIANQSSDSTELLLSEREVDVLKCLASGQTTAEIASGLFISENTVKTHIRHILEKLDASNRAEAVRKAVTLGIIQ